MFLRLTGLRDWTELRDVGTAQRGRREEQGGRSPADNWLELDQTKPVDSVEEAKLKVLQI